LAAVWTGRGLAATAVLAVAGGLLLVVWQGPWWLGGGRLTDKELTGPAATLVTGFRTTVVQGLVALVALWFTWRNYRLTRHGQVTHTAQVLGEHIHLNYRHLVGAWLDGTNLTDAWLYGANLTSAKG
jgi:hypothetical protein